MNSIFENGPPTILKFIETQRTDTYCNQIKTYIGLPNTTFTYGKHGILASKARIDGAIRKVVPTLLRTWTLNPTHYSVLAGHPEERRMRLVEVTIFLDRYVK